MPIAITPLQNMRVAMDAVWAHRFRSLLTILGIVIGITTVVTVSSLLTGLRQGIVTFFQELGPDNVFVYKFSGDPSAGRGPMREMKRRPIKPEYAEQLKRFAGSVQDTSLTLYIPSIVNGQPVVAKVPGFETESVNMEGETPNSIDMTPRDFRLGRYFTPEENDRLAHVAVLGSNLSDALFPDGRPLGRTLMADGAEYTVIGVLEKAKGGFFGENGMDNLLLMPYKTAVARYPQLDRFMVTAKAKTGRRKEAYDEVEAILRRLRHLPRNTPNDFSLSSPDQIIAQFDQITGLIVMVSIAISALGLVVGGIGVMNIMLVSVTERTREIGVRKALGARRLDIVGQFLAEAAALTGAGGVLGILIAIGATFLIGYLVPSLPSAVPLWAVVAGFSVSVAVGVFFGVWPAVKASRLDPVEALRYE
jgi:putative ABC transport system permease protein